MRDPGLGPVVGCSVWGCSATHKQLYAPTVRFDGWQAETRGVTQGQTRFWGLRFDSCVTSTTTAGLHTTVVGLDITFEVRQRPFMPSLHHSFVAVNLNCIATA
jgi:hypothetical protein